MFASIWVLVVVAFISLLVAGWKRTAYGLVFTLTVMLNMVACGRPATNTTPTTEDNTPTPVYTVDVQGKATNITMVVPAGFTNKEIWIHFATEVDENTFLDACVDMEHAEYNTMPSGTGMSKWYWEIDPTYKNILRVHGNTLVPGTWYFTLKGMSKALPHIEKFSCN